MVWYRCMLNGPQLLTAVQARELTMYLDYDFLRIWRFVRLVLIVRIFGRKTAISSASSVICNNDENKHYLIAPAFYIDEFMSKQMK